jgi:hypothetical protein
MYLLNFTKSTLSNKNLLSGKLEMEFKLSLRYPYIYYFYISNFNHEIRVLMQNMYE